MDELTLDEAMEDMESAEDFLNYFGVAYEPSVVHVNRLHILQRFHNYICLRARTSAVSCIPICWSRPTKTSCFRMPSRRRCSRCSTCMNPRRLLCP